MPKPKEKWIRISMTRLKEMKPDLKPYDFHKILMIDSTTATRVYREIRKKPLKVSYEEEHEIVREIYMPKKLEKVAVEKALYSRLINSIYRGLEWVKNCQLKIRGKWSGWPRHLFEAYEKRTKKPNWEVTSYTLNKFLLCYKYNIISDNEFEEWNLYERLRGAIEFLLNSRHEDEEIVGWRNPYIRDTPLCPRITGNIISNLKNAEKFGKLDFTLDKEIERKAINFIRKECIRYVEEILTPRIALFQIPVVAYLDCMRGIISSIGKKRFLRDALVRDILSEKLFEYYTQRGSTGGGFGYRRGDEPDIETTTCVIKTIFTEEGFSLTLDEVENFFPLTKLVEMKSFIQPEKGEEIESKSHPVIPALRLLSMLLLGAHPCSSLVRKRLNILLNMQGKDGNWANSIENTAATVSELLFSANVIADFIKDPEIYYRKLEKIHFSS